MSINNNDERVNAIAHMVLQLCEQSRFPGTKGSADARAFIRDRLETCGYVVSESKERIPSWRQIGDPFVEYGTPRRRVEALPVMLSPPTSTEGIEGRLFDAGIVKMLGCFPWPSLQVIDPNGQAIAAILSSERELRVQPLPLDQPAIPHVIVSFEVFQDLRQLCGRSGTVHVYNGSDMTGQTQLVSLFTENSEGPSLLVCAHYDTTFNSMGALDNATGVAVALQVAEEAVSGRWNSRFAFFDGEELNHSGSSGYVNGLTDADLARIAAVIEIDTVGAGDEVCLLCSKKLAKVVNRSRWASALPFGFTSNVQSQSRITFCDVWPFMARGVPVIRMLTRGEGIKVIHTPADTKERVENSALAASYAATVALLDVLNDWLVKVK